MKQLFASWYKYFFPWILKLLDQQIPEFMRQEAKFEIKKDVTPLSLFGSHISVFRDGRHPVLVSVSESILYPAGQYASLILHSDAGRGKYRISVSCSEDQPPPFLWSKGLGVVCQEVVPMGDRQMGSQQQWQWGQSRSVQWIPCITAAPATWLFSWTYWARTRLAGEGVWLDLWCGSSYLPDY